MQRLTGRFILLNVLVEGVQTSVCVNKRADGAAAWRRKEDNRRIQLLLDAPGFSVVPQTLALTFGVVNVLANNFHAIFEAIPVLAVDDQGGVAIGRLPRDGAEMGQLLTNLEQLSKAILEIELSLEQAIGTPIHALYRNVGHRTLLTNGDDLSEYGKTLLTSFSASQHIYATLPQLRGFGSDNRIQHQPTMRGALLRYYMQQNSINPLSTSHSLDFVDYELKPLHISDTLKWNCESDSRNESVDLLLSLNSSPVITEVKMAGDSFVSSAVVQIMYYASIMANEQQKARVAREYVGFTSLDGWLWIIAEKRDEARPGERGFGNDLRSAITFLEHQQTRTVMSPFYQGVAVAQIQELPEPFCRTRDIPMFQVVEGSEHCVAWR